ncbi:peptidoglycan-binding protein [Thermocoleostomius sinensis]|uniref:Peptidoglycan-binding protein n=1 Tax=Thermocoleostomius sinensis A174 TaxID=2016057 RepID=A0A9E9C8T6_9CYAN|nr:peptidoglycan-binding protein [Thermocoleostomius sinensis]WAL60648.1 peptidoglycan-binding protein [Thermocoleostomius sinensis A174]
MAANPSALLLLTCVTCTDAATTPTPVSVSTCPEPQHQSQGNSAVAVTAAVDCISSPETVAVVQPVRSNLASTRQDLHADNSSQVHRLDSTIPRPTEPESFHAVLTASDRQTRENGQSRRTSESMPLSMPLLRLGSRGEAVSRLQTHLHQLGHYTGEIDGIYGSKTEAAVAKFQQFHGLGVDGVVGALTWQKLQAREGQSTAAPAFENTDSGRSSQAAPSQATEPAVAIEPSEETKSAPASNQLRPEATTAPQPIEREPVDNDSLYYWMLLWALVYGGGNVVIFWNRTISSLWFNLLEKLVPQRPQSAVATPKTAKPSFAKPTVQPTSAVASRRSASPDQAVKPTAKSTTDRAPQSSTPQPSAAPASVPQTSSISSSMSSSISTEAAYQAEINGNVAASGMEPVLEAALANDGVIEPLRNLVVDSSTSPQQQAPTHRTSQRFSASTARSNHGYRAVTLPEPSTPISIANHTARNQRVTKMPQMSINSSQLSNDPDRPVEEASTLVATLPASDAKTGNTYTYTLLNNAEGYFKIEGNELRIMNKAVLNVEDKVCHIVTVRRTDAKGVSIDKSFILNLNKAENVKPKSSTNASVHPIQPLPLVQPG